MMVSDPYAIQLARKIVYHAQVCGTGDLNLLAGELLRLYNIEQAARAVERSRIGPLPEKHSLLDFDLDILRDRLLDLDIARSRLAPGHTDLMVPP